MHEHVLLGFPRKQVELFFHAIVATTRGRLDPVSPSRLDGVSPYQVRPPRDFAGRVNKTAF